MLGRAERYNPEFVYFEPDVTKRPGCQHTVQLALKKKMSFQTKYTYLWGRA